MLRRWGQQISVIDLQYDIDNIQIDLKKVSTLILNKGRVPIFYNFVKMTFLGIYCIRIIYLSTAQKYFFFTKSAFLKSGSSNKIRNYFRLLWSLNFAKLRKMIVEFLSGLFAILISIKLYLSKYHIEMQLIVGICLKSPFLVFFQNKAVCNG